MTGLALVVPMQGPAWPGTDGVTGLVDGHLTPIEKDLLQLIYRSHRMLFGVDTALGGAAQTGASPTRCVAE